jgi:RecA-family ATPase
MLARADVVRLREAQQSDQFSTINPASWEGRLPPRRDWMVERCIVRGSVALVSGDGGIGKSLLMQQLCTSAAMGRPWLGLSCRPGRAIFFGCEDDHDELWRRQYDINRTLGLTMAEVGEAGLELAPRVGFDNTLSRLDRREWRMVVTELFERLLAACLELGVTYVVIDTATQAFAGNQNDEQQVVQFCNQLRRLAIGIQGCVIITRHPSVAGRALGTGESGSVSWHNSVRGRLYLHKDKEGLRLEHRKSNYGPADVKIPLRWERGCFVLDEAPMPSYHPYRDD